MAIGDIGTGKGSTVLLNEEYSYGTIGTSTAVWLRRISDGFGRNPIFVQSGHAASDELGYSKQTTESAVGSIDYEIDMTTIGRILKWQMGTSVATINSTQQGATSEYKHTFKWGSTFKTIQALKNIGGLSTPKYQKASGLFPTNTSFNLDMSGVMRGSTDFIGKTVADGTNPGSATLADDNLTIGFGGVSYVTGTAGSASPADAWTDPFDFELNLIRVGAENKNYRSDGTGLPIGIYEGQPAVNLKLATQLTTGHKLAVFEADTEISLGITLDTGVAIPSGNGSNYKLVIVFPRVVMEDYQIRGSGPGVVLPVIQIGVMKDPTLGYSVRMDLYNNTTSYADSTA